MAWNPSSRGGFARSWCPKCRSAVQAQVPQRRWDLELQCPTCGAWLATASVGGVPLSGVPEAPKVRFPEPPASPPGKSPAPAPDDCDKKGG
jgi:ribosomal protein S27E